MYDDDEGLPTTAIVLTVSIATFLGGFAFGLYAVRGWVLFGPEIAEERRRNLADEVESDESDVELDEADGNTLLDHAPNWSNSAEADRRDGLRQRGANAAKGRNGKKSKTEKLVDVDDAPAPNAAAGNSNEECKLVLVVRTDLGMTKGKIAAQCSHATLACYKTLSRQSSKGDAAATALLRRWERHGQAKIAVQVKSQEALLELLGKARSLGVTSEVIQDAGRTQIEAGSMTVLGVGPAPKSLVDQITGGLKLL